MNENFLINIPDEEIIAKIYEMRGVKVMLDRDLATLYDVQTKRLKEAVRRNILRFPEDFMFELSNEEFQIWRKQNIKSGSDKMGLRYPPFAFTEHGVLMLASILNSERAILVNIQIVRVFIRMREIMSGNKEMMLELGKIKNRLSEHDGKILFVIKYLKQFEQFVLKEKEQKNRPKIGFKTKNEPTNES